MTTFYDFATNSPWITFFLAVGILNLISVMFRQCLRTVRVWLCGWPPPHLDLDGDFKPDPEKDNEAKGETP